MTSNIKVLFIRYQKEENRLKQGGTTSACPINHVIFSPLQSVLKCFILCVLMNMTQQLQDDDNVNPLSESLVKYLCLFPCHVKFMMKNTVLHCGVHCLQHVGVRRVFITMYSFTQNHYCDQFTGLGKAK